MNRKVICKKVKILFWVSVIMSVVCCGLVACKQQKKSAPYTNHNTPVKEFLFSISEYKINGTSESQNPEKYYVSKNVTRFLNSYAPDRGHFLSVADVYRPYNKGLFESHGFYDSSSDTGDWIEDCLIAYEEERLAAVFEENMEIESPVSIEGFDEDFDFVTDFAESEGHIDLSEEVVVENDFDDSDLKNGDGKAVSTDSVEKRLLDSNARLRMLMFDEEIFVPEARTGEQVLISSDGKKVRRSFYDDKYRLVKREHWNITDLKTSSITKLEEYGYSGTNLSLSEKSITTDSTKIKTYFNNDGTAYKSETYKYAVIKDNKKSDSESDGSASAENEKVQYLSSSIEWKYDKDGKITSEATATYEYKNDNYSKPSKIYRKRQVYAYHEDEEIPPDYQYFEDGKLRLRTIYTSKNEYRTDTIFDSNYTVRAFYVDSKKVREVYYQNGKAIRTRKYE